MTKRERRFVAMIAEKESIIRDCREEIEEANERVRSHQKLTDDLSAAYTEIASLKDIDRVRRKEVQLLRDTLFVTAKMLAEAGRK